MKEFFSTILKTRKQGVSIAVGSTNVRYGKEEKARPLFDEIISIKDKLQRKNKIIKLIETLEKDSENNSFFCRNEGIKLTRGACFELEPPQFKIDDIEFYEMFFNKYIEQKSSTPEFADSKIHKLAIIHTLNSYFGEFNGNAELRNALTHVDVDTEKFDNADYKPEIPSIKKFKSQNCAMCVEQASASHNLWLLGGYKSYCIDASSIKLANIPDEAHNYCIVKINDRFALFDPSLQIFGLFKNDFNPVEDVLNGKPLSIDYNGQTYVYANNFALENNLNRKV